MVERRQDGSGQELHGPIVLSRRALRPEVIAVDWFADYSNGGGGVRILPEGVEGVDGLPVDYLCGPMDFWIEAEDGAGDIVTSTKTMWYRSSVADCSDTPRRF